jgi:hypothetical protein
MGAPPLTRFCVKGGRAESESAGESLRLA